MDASMKFTVHLIPHFPAPTGILLQLWGTHGVRT